MPLFPKTLFTGLAPHTNARIARAALASLVFPWRWSSWLQGSSVSKIESALQEHFSVSNAITFDSGRTALHEALRALGIGKGDSVLVQAYTCAVVSNAIIWTGATPIYVDVDASLTMDPNDAAKKIQPSTKAMIIQHTFGAPANTTALTALAATHNIRTIEDCAHAFGLSQSDGRMLGTIADIGMLSFGSDKAISSVRGGALITNNPTLGKMIRDRQQSLSPMPILNIIRHLLHPILFYIGRGTYAFFGLGKAVLYASKRLFLTARMVSSLEKKGIQPSYVPAMYPNVLARTLLPSLSHMRSLNAHRTHIARVYAAMLDTSITQPHATVTAPIRYTVLVDNPQRIEQAAKQKHILLGNWYRTPVDPPDTDRTAMQYAAHTCPHAETYAQQSLNLPTGPSISPQDAAHIAHIVNTLCTQ